MKHQAKDEEKKVLIEKITHTMFHGFKEIVAVYLFGSFISETFFSDIDIGVLTRDPVRRILQFEMNMESEIEKIVDYPVDVRLLNTAPISFVQNVIRHGQVIVDREPNFRADFQGMVLKKYFDFSPFRRRYLEEVVNAPV